MTPLKCKSNVEICWPIFFPTQKQHFISKFCTTVAMATALQSHLFSYLNAANEIKHFAEEMK